MKWRIHLGAHKTATTHFQDILEINRAHLAHSGVLYVPRDRLRESKINNLIVKSPQPPNAERVFRDVFKSEFLDAPQPIHTILVSEENILGTSGDLLHYPMYARADARLRRWKDALGDQDVALYLSVRNIADILPSAYSQATRQGFSLKPFEHYLEGYSQLPPCWTNLATRIRRVFPKAPLIIWKFEDYIRSPNDIFRRLAVGGIDIPEIKIPERTRSLSKSTIDRLQSLNAMPLPKPWRKKLSKAFTRFDDGEKYAPVSDHQRRCLTTAYEAELQDLSEFL